MTVSVEKYFLVSFKERSKRIRNISHFPLTFVGMEGAQHIQRSMLWATFSKLLISKWLDKTIAEVTPYWDTGKKTDFKELGGLP